MNGMGMLHLEIKQHRMERDFRLKVRVGKPRVSYRETSAKSRFASRASASARPGRRGLFAKVTRGVRAVPGRRVDPGAVATCRRTTLPPEFIAAAEQGIRGALDSGELGYPVMNVRATIVGGEMDEQFSNETAFQAAGADAVHKAMRDNIVLLEPVDAAGGDGAGGVPGPGHGRPERPAGRDREAARRRRAGAVIEALVPAAKMFDYADKVRSLSQGRASSSMEPHAYRPAPPDVLEAMLHPEDF